MMMTITTIVKKKGYDDDNDDDDDDDDNRSVREELTSVKQCLSQTSPCAGRSSTEGSIS